MSKGSTDYHASAIDQMASAYNNMRSKIDASEYQALDTELVRKMKDMVK